MLIGADFLCQNLLLHFFSQKDYPFSTWDVTGDA